MTRSLGHHTSFYLLNLCVAHLTKGNSTHREQYCVNLKKNVAPLKIRCTLMNGLLKATVKSEKKSDCFKEQKRGAVFVQGLKQFSQIIF